MFFFSFYTFLSPFSLVRAIRPFTIVIDGQHFLRWGIERLSPLGFPGFTSRRNDGLYDFVNFPIVSCPSHPVSRKNHAALARAKGFSRLINEHSPRSAIHSIRNISVYKFIGTSFREISFRDSELKFEWMFGDFRGNDFLVATSVTRLKEVWSADCGFFVLLWEIWKCVQFHIICAQVKYPNIIFNGRNNLLLECQFFFHADKSTFYVQTCSCNFNTRYKMFLRYLV